MAVGLKSRIIYRQKTKENNTADYWAGKYSLLIRAKSIPSPVGERNMVDTSTLEDLVETQEPGRLENLAYQTNCVREVGRNLTLQTTPCQVTVTNLIDPAARTTPAAAAPLMKVRREISLDIAVPSRF